MNFFIFKPSNNIIKTICIIIALSIFGAPLIGCMMQPPFTPDVSQGQTETTTTTYIPIGTTEPTQSETTQPINTTQGQTSGTTSPSQTQTTETTKPIHSETTQTTTSQSQTTRPTQTTETTKPTQSQTTKPTEPSQSETTKPTDPGFVEPTTPDNPSSYKYKLTSDNITNISKDKNVFVFVIDRFDRVFAEAAFAHEPSLFSGLDGFTYFEDNISLYGHTYPAIAHMVTGNKYEGEKRKDYLDSTYDNASTLSELRKNGYQVNVYAASYYGYNSSYYISKYISNARMPENGSKVVEYSYKLDGLEEYFTSAKFNLVNENVYSFIHLEGCHDCYFGGGTAPEKLKDTQVEKAITALKRNFDIINKYIKQMKEWGVYDDATIIITGDHGSAISDTKMLDGIRTTALFVKPSGSSNTQLKRSSAQVSHDNLWATIFKSEGIKTQNSYGKSVFDIKEGDDQLREYEWHMAVTEKATETEPEKKYFIEYKYKIMGSALDFENWILAKETKYDRTLYS